MSEIENIISEVVLSHQDWVNSYKNGNQKLFGLFVKEVLDKLDDKYDLNVVNSEVRKSLEKILE